MKHIIALLIALTLNAAANLLMKIGMKRVAEQGDLLDHGVFGAIRTILSSAPLMIGLVSFGLNAACYMYALQSKKLPISIAYPIMVGGGFALIVTVAAYHPALRETLNTTQMAGIALVLGGILLIASQMK